MAWKGRGGEGRGGEGRGRGGEGRGRGEGSGGERKARGGSRGVMYGQGCNTPSVSTFKFKLGMCLCTH